MLEVIKKLDSGTIKGLIVVTIPVLVVLGSMFGLDEAVFRSQLETWAEKLLLVVTLGGAAFAAYARLFKPTPPLTETAKQATQAAIAEGKLQTTTGDSVKSAQGGFSLTSMLCSILIAASVIASIGISAGCTNTRAALQAADTPSDFALVFLEGYDAALKSANSMKDSGTLTGKNLECVRIAELKAWPLVQKIDPLRSAYENTHSAADAQALQLAIDAAIREAADFVRIVRELRSGEPNLKC